MKNLFIIFTIVSTTISLFGQDFDEIIAAGDVALAQGKYDTALVEYFAAQATDPLRSDIVETKITYAYTEINNRRIEFEKQNIVLKNTIKAVEEQRNRAEIAEAEAKREAAIAKANLLSYKAQQLIEEDSFQIAFDSAFAAMQQLDTLYVPYVSETFGEAVYHQYKQTIDDIKYPIQNTKYLTNGGFLLSVSDNRRNYQAVLTDTSGKTIKTIKHKKAILSTSVTATEDKILTCSADHTAKLYDVIRDTTVHFKEHSDEVMGGAFSKDGNLIVTWSRDDTTLLWNPMGEVIATLEAHKGNVYEVIFSPDEEKIVTRSSDQTAILWSKEGKLLDTLNQHKSYIYQIAFSPDNINILSCSADSTAILWNSETNHKVVLPHKSIVRKGVFSSDGNKIMTISQDNQLNVWIKGNRITQSRIWLTHNYPIKEAWFSNDGSKILSCDKSKHFYLWDLNAPNPQIPQKIERHQEEILSARFSKNGEYILTHARDNTAKLWKFEDGELHLRMDIAHTGNTFPQFTPDGKNIITSSSDKTIDKTPLPDILYNLLTPKPEEKTGQ